MKKFITKKKKGKQNFGMYFVQCLHHTQILLYHVDQMST